MDKVVLRQGRRYNPDASSWEPWFTIDPVNYQHWYENVLEDPSEYQMRSLVLHDPTLEQDAMRWRLWSNAVAEASHNPDKDPALFAALEKVLPEDGPIPLTAEQFGNYINQAAALLP